MEEELRDFLDAQANGHLFNDDSQEPEVNKTNERPPSTKTEKPKAKKKRVNKDDNKENGVKQKNKKKEKVLSSNHPMNQLLFPSTTNFCFGFLRD